MATVPDLAVKPVQLRAGMSDMDAASRVVHLVSTSSELDGLDEVEACCGVRLMPGVWEDAPWGELWPHTVCVSRAPVRRSALERAFYSVESVQPYSDEEWAHGLRTVEKVLNSREDWVNEDDSGDWVYTASFNGALSGEHRFPRGVDVGFEPLTAELVRPYAFRVHYCGVREGCPKHAVQSATFSLDEEGVIKERLSVHEDKAVSIDLQELAWCLIFGACSTVTLTAFLR